MAIDSYEDDLLTPLTEEAPASPIHQPKLKRLKKSTSSSSPMPPIRVSSDDSIVSNLDSNSNLHGDCLDPLFSVMTADEGFETLDMDEGKLEKKKRNFYELYGKSKELSPTPLIRGFGDNPIVPNSNLSADGLGPLFSALVAGGGSETLGNGKKKSVRKRLCMEEGEELILKRKKNKTSNSDESARERRIIEKAPAGLNVASHTSTNDTQDVDMRPESTDGHDELDNLEDSPDPNLRSSNINHIPHDLLSEEEEDDDDDKENIDPHSSHAVNIDSSPSSGLAKVFLDDEAEEEDASDHDLTRFQESEGDDGNDENDLVGLIASGYKEAPVDCEKRNQLHQKWLEQQDATGADNILQRLNCGQKQSEPTSPDDEDDEECDEASNDLPVTSMVQQNAKKAKRMIAQMFNDEDDMCIPSDDEESEQTLIRQRVLKQRIKSSFISPIEDEHSREVFGLIKKLNIAPTTKRGRNATSSFDMVVGNNNSSSKDSKGSQPSRTGILTDIRISSKFKSTSSTAMAETNSSSGSLFGALRHSSMHFDGQLKDSKGISSHEVTEAQAAHQFSAFKWQTQR